jgi:uncharacterized membrane protein
MIILKRVGFVTCLLMLFTIFMGLAAGPINAADTPVEEVKLNTKYPSLSATSGSSYEFDVDLTYSGGDLPKIFELKAKAPNGFYAQISRSYGGGANLAAIQLDPLKSYTPETIKVSVAPALFVLPDPGEYKITITATSGKVIGSIDLTAVVTAKFELKLVTPEGLLNTNVTVGKDNFFTYKVTNTGTAALEKINFSNSVRGGPSGWGVTFDPKNIDTLPVGAERDVQINIKPPEKTIAGDYEINLTASTQSNNASDKLTIRVTVLTPTIWGWVGVIIVVIVVVGLIAMFWRLGRR